MRTGDLADLLDVATTTIPRLARRAGVGDAIGRTDAWSPGDALALLVLAELDGEARFAAGARKAGEAVDNGFAPAWLVTRGGEENLVVIETEDPEATDEMTRAVLMQASDAGAAVRVVPLRPLVRRLAPWIRDLVDV